MCSGCYMQGDVVRKTFLLMKYLFLIFMFSISQILTAQDDLPPGHDEFMAEHFKNVDMAAKMLAYDHVARVSSDSIQTLPEEKLKTYGGQWFCFLDSIGRYHALYGAYDSTYTLTAHYIVDSTTFAVRRTYQPFDTALAIQYSTAYNLALERKKQFLGPEDKLRYNHFIFRTDSSIQVHFLPGYQSSGYLVYGAELHYTINLTADQIIDTVEYFDEYRGHQPNPEQEISIEYDDLDKTTIGSIFFLMSNERYFNSIRLYTMNYLTTFIRDKNGEMSWIHAVRQEPKVRKKKRKGGP